MFCRTSIVQQDVDLTNVCGSDGFLFERQKVGFASNELLLQIPESQINETLTSITNLTPEHPDPIAFSLVPFNPEESAVFYLPATLFSRDSEGVSRITVIGHSKEAASEEALAVAESQLQHCVSSAITTNTFTVSPLTDVDAYLSTVVAARDAVNAGDLDKAVIARDISVTATDSINVHNVLERLRASFGNSYRFSVDSMIGASPELLVERKGRIVRSHPLAGTAPRTGDPDTDTRLANELIASTKNQVEHRLVINMVHDTLLPFCSYLDWEAEPSIVTVANVQHLGTAIEGALTEPSPSVLELVRRLCPTPALGGFPSKEAIDFIQCNEPMERRFYGGAVGVLDKTGDGTFAVLIRCAEFSPDKKSARLFAGGGIVGQSDPESELAETQAKFQAMLSAIVRP